MFALTVSHTVLAPAFALVRRTVATVNGMMIWHKSRRLHAVLCALDDHALNDIGLTRADLASQDRLLRKMKAAANAVGLRPV